MIQYCPLETSNVDPTSESHLSVYPNPMEDEATVLLPASQKPSILVMYSLTGQVVRQIPVTNTESSISRDGLPNGMYFLAVIEDGRVFYMTKLVIAG